MLVVVVNSWSRLSADNALSLNNNMVHSVNNENHLGSFPGCPLAHTCDRRHSHESQGRH